MHAISSYRGNRPTTNTHIHKQQTNPQTGPITIHCVAKLSAKCNNRTQKNGLSEQHTTHSKECYEKGQTELGLFAFYDIRPGNRAYKVPGFRRPHRVHSTA